MVLVRKPDGRLRVCQDYRLLNAKTYRDAYPLPRIEEALQAMKGAKYFCSLDLAHGFYQLAIADEDIHKTAFRAGTGGLYEFLRMPMGLCGAPGRFMRVMDKIFGDQNFQTIINYIDDLLVFASSVEEMNERLDMVLTRLAKHGLKVKPEKCHLFKQKIKYLGHEISETGISPDPGKISAMMEWEIPRTEQELRAFLGLCGYYRRFVPGFARLAAPLHALLSGTGKGPNNSKRKYKDTKFQPLGEKWDEKCTTAFNQLKTHLTSPPILGHPDFSKPFILEVDARFLGLGAVLSQEQEGKRVVLAYASRSLHKQERNISNYISMKLELLALKWAVTSKFRDMLMGTNFVVYTDNNPLSYLMKTAKLGATEMRWAAELSQFDFTIRYRSGISNGNADALSRKVKHGQNSSFPTEEGLSIEEIQKFWHFSLMEPNYQRN